MHFTIFRDGNGYRYTWYMFLNLFFIFIHLLWPAMAIDRYISNILWPVIAIDGHRWEYLAVGNVYRWTPSPAYFHTYNVLRFIKNCNILCRSHAIISSCVITTSMEWVHGVSWWAVMWVHGIAWRRAATLCLSSRQRASWGLSVLHCRLCCWGWYSVLLIVIPWDRWGRNEHNIP